MSEITHDKDCPYCHPREKYIRQILDEKDTLEVGLRNQITRLQTENEAIRGENACMHKVNDEIQIRLGELREALKEGLERITFDCNQDCLCANWEQCASSDVQAARRWCAKAKALIEGVEK